MIARKQALRRPFVPTIPKDKGRRDSKSSCNHTQESTVEQSRAELIALGVMAFDAGPSNNNEDPDQGDAPTLVLERREPTQVTIEIDVDLSEL